MEDRFKFRFWDTSTIPQMKYDLVVKTEGKLFNSLFFDAEEKNIIVMQCTGLEDNTGKLIYEGDIVKTFIGNFIIRYCYICKSYQLFSVEEDYCFSCEGDLHWFEFLEELDKTEIIGNIYENPELLESN